MATNIHCDYYYGKCKPWNCQYLIKVCLTIAHSGIHWTIIKNYGNVKNIENFQYSKLNSQKKKKTQPNSFSCWERDRMNVPKSKNPKIKNKNKNKIYNTNIYYSLPHRIYIPLFLHPVEINRPWRDEWMTKQMNRWMKWCFTMSFTICNRHVATHYTRCITLSHLARLVPCKACWASYPMYGATSHLFHNV
jgi:hypothetical protein